MRRPFLLALAVVSAMALAAARPTAARRACRSVSCLLTTRVILLRATANGHVRGIKRNSA